MHHMAARYSFLGGCGGGLAAAPGPRCAEVDTTWLRSDAWPGSPSYRLPYAWSVRALWSSTRTRVNAELVAMGAIFKKTTHHSYVAYKITVDVRLYSRSTHTYGRSDLLWPPVYSEYCRALLCYRSRVHAVLLYYKHIAFSQGSVLVSTST